MDHFVYFILNGIADHVSLITCTIFGIIIYNMSLPLIYYEDQLKELHHQWVELQVEIMLMADYYGYIGDGGYEQALYFLNNLGPFPDRALLDHYLQSLDELEGAILYRLNPWYLPGLKKHIYRIWAEKTDPLFYYYLDLNYGG